MVKLNVIGSNFIRQTSIYITNVSVKKQHVFCKHLNLFSFKLLNLIEIFRDNLIKYTFEGRDNLLAFLNTLC